MTAKKAKAKAKAKVRKKPSRRRAPAVDPASAPTEDSDGYPLKMNGYPMSAMERKMSEEYVGNGFKMMVAGRAAGYSEGFLDKKGHLVIERCYPYIKLLQDRQQRRHAITPAAVKGELSNIAFANLQDYLVQREGGKDGEVRFKRPSELTREEMAAIKTFTLKVTTDGIEYEYTFHDKRQSLMDMARVLGMVDSKLQILNAQNVEVKNYSLESLPTEDLEEIERFYMKKLGAVKGQGRLIEGESKDVTGKQS